MIFNFNISESSLRFSENVIKVRNRIIELYNEGLDIDQIIEKIKKENKQAKNLTILQRNNVESAIRSYLRLNARKKAMVIEKLKKQNRKEKKPKKESVQKRRDPKLVEEVIKLKKDGYSAGKIGQKLKITRNTVIGIIRDYRDK